VGPANYCGQHTFVSSKILFLHFHLTYTCSTFSSDMLWSIHALLSVAHYYKLSCLVGYATFCSFWQFTETTAPHARCHFTCNHYRLWENLCSYSLMLHAQQSSIKYHYRNLRFYPTRDRTNNLPHSLGKHGNHYTTKVIFIIYK
jgi:hypothetical protein